MCNYSFGCLGYNKHGIDCDSHTGQMCSNYSVTGTNGVNIENANSGKFCVTKRKPYSDMQLLNAYQLSIENGVLCARINSIKNQINSTGQPEAVYWIYDIKDKPHATTSLLKKDCGILIGMALTDDDGDWINCRIM